MNTLAHHRSPSKQRGVVLITAILLLIVMTLLALGMFKSFGVQELIAGNVREKQRAVQSAESAEQYAEQWLTAPGNILTNSVDCKLSAIGLVAYGPNAVPYICTQPLAAITDTLTATTVPWKVSSVETGFAFYPGATSANGDMTVSATGVFNSYYQVPRFYIGVVSYSATQALYRIDAWNYAATTTTPAVVESNYVVNCTTCGLGGP